MNTKCVWAKLWCLCMTVLSPKHKECCWSLVLRVIVRAILIVSYLKLWPPFAHNWNMSAMSHLWCFCMFIGIVYIKLAFVLLIHEMLEMVSWCNYSSCCLNFISISKCTQRNKHNFEYLVYRWRYGFKFRNGNKMFATLQHTLIRTASCVFMWKSSLHSPCVLQPVLYYIWVALLQLSAV